jgi:hypothetical protein
MSDDMVLALLQVGLLWIEENFGGKIGPYLFIMHTPKSLTFWNLLAGTEKRSRS